VHKKYTWLFWSGLTVAVVAGIAWTREPAVSASPELVKRTESRPPHTETRSEPEPVLTGLNVYGSNVASQGVKACAHRVSQVTDFLAGDKQTKSAAFIFPVPAPNNKHLLSMSMSVAAPNAPLAYVATTYAPVSSTGCDASYEAVIYWPKACPEVSSEQFPGARPGNDVGGLAVRVIGPNAVVFLLPAGAGCVSIKKEDVFQ
jgi:hypothetical protein